MEIKDEETAKEFCESWSTANESRQIRYLTFAIESQEKVAKLHRLYGRVEDEYNTLQALGVLRRRRLALRLKT